MKTVAITAVLIAGCAAPAAYRSLPRAEVDAFEACASFVEQRACAGYSSPLGRAVEGANCMDGIRGKYASLPPEARRSFLVEAGCPSALVAASR